MDIEREKRNIADKIGQWRAGFNNGDFALLQRLMAPDAILTLPFVPIVLSGWDDISHGLDAFFRQFVSRDLWVTKTDDVRIHGEHVATCYNEWSLNLSDGLGNNTLTYYRSGTTLIHQQDEWMIVCMYFLEIPGI